jgi:hypothetical protein
MYNNIISKEQIKVWADKRGRKRFRTAMIAKIFTFQMP